MPIIIEEGSLNVTYKRCKACGNKLFLVNWIYFPALAESIFHLVGFTGTQNDSILCLGKTKKLFLFNNEKEDLLETDHLEFVFCNLFPLIWSSTLCRSQKCQSLYLKASDREKKKVFLPKQSSSFEDSHPGLCNDVNDISGQTNERVKIHLLIQNANLRTELLRGSRCHLGHLY